MSEEELPIQVTEIDGVKVDDVDFTKATEDQVLEKFAPNPSRAYHEYFGLIDVVSCVIHLHKAGRLLGSGGNRREPQRVKGRMGNRQISKRLMREIFDFAKLNKRPRMPSRSRRKMRVGLPLSPSRSWFHPEIGH